MQSLPEPKSSFLYFLKLVVWSLMVVLHCPAHWGYHLSTNSSHSQQQTAAVGGFSGANDLGFWCWRWPGLGAVPWGVEGLWGSGCSALLSCGTNCLAGITFSVSFSHVTVEQLWKIVSRWGNADTFLKQRIRSEQNLSCKLKKKKGNFNCAVMMWMVTFSDILFRS